MTQSNSPGTKNGKQTSNGIGAELTKKIKAFQLSPVFKDLSEDSLTEIAAAASFRHFKKGEFIVNEGDPSTVFRLIFEGRVKYFKEATSGVTFHCECRPSR